jgi:hypothetical protein
MMEKKIRTIPADQDPRRATEIESIHNRGSPPPLSGPQFPSLCEHFIALKIGDPKPTPLTHTYSHVLVYGINRPNILIKLPVEVREMIWEAHMQASGVFDTSRINIRDFVKIDDNPERPQFLPALCSMSPLTEAEIIGVFMRNSKFMIASIFDNAFFRKFVASVPNGPAHVRELHFDFFHWFPDYDEKGKRIPVNSDLELAVHCNGLHTLRLTFGFKNMRDANTGIPKTVEQLVEKYRLRRLLDCDKLRNIRWDGQREFGAAVPVLYDLADWVKSEFAKKNQRVECVVTWRR